VLRKRITVLQRRDDLDRAAFDVHWAGPHVPIVLRLPGVQRYLQHHVLGGADGLDGLVEITFTAPDDAPAHCSNEQQADEHRFLSGLTGLSVSGTAVCAAPYAAWLVGSPVGDLPTVAGVDPVVSMRDPAAPVMRRQRLRSLRPVPELVAAWPAANAAEAREVAGLLAAGAADGWLTAATKTHHIL
jgi:hypothetical protein